MDGVHIEDETKQMIRRQSIDGSIGIIVSN
jgi:hypothetical protein